MTAIVPTTVEIGDMPMSSYYGTTTKRRKLVFITATSTSGGTIDLSDHVPNISDIEGLFYQTTDNAQFSSTATWSSDDLTIVDTGAIEIGVIVNLS